MFFSFPTDALDEIETTVSKLPSQLKMTEVGIVNMKVKLSPNGQNELHRGIEDRRKGSSGHSESQVEMSQSIMRQ